MGVMACMTSPHPSLPIDLQHYDLFFRDTSLHEAATDGGHASSRPAGRQIKMCARLIDWHTSQRHSKPSQYFARRGRPVLGPCPSSQESMRRAPWWVGGLHCGHASSLVHFSNFDPWSPTHPPTHTPPGLGLPPHLHPPCPVVLHGLSQTVPETGQPHFCSSRPSAPLPRPAHPCLAR